jgi:hypothetical protein
MITDNWEQDCTKENEELWTCLNIDKDNDSLCIKSILPSGNSCGKHITSLLVSECMPSVFFPSPGAILSKKSGSEQDCTKENEELWTCLNIDKDNDTHQSSIQLNEQNTDHETEEGEVNDTDSEVSHNCL